MTTRPENPKQMSPAPSTEHAETNGSARSRKQLGLFLAGASFVVFSSLITRRAFARRRVSTTPAFYQQSNGPPRMTFSGPLEAVEALGLATVHVTSTFMMVTGGLLWAFDISSIDDLRRKIRGGMGIDGTGRSEKDVEEEFEEWIATALDRKKAKEEKRQQQGPSEVQYTNERGKPR